MWSRFATLHATANVGGFWEFWVSSSLCVTATLPFKCMLRRSMFWLVCPGISVFGLG